MDWYMWYSTDETLALGALRSERNKQPDYAYAWIIVGNTRKMAMVTRDLKEAYKLESKSPAPTNMKWSKFHFIRWMSGMEL